MEIRRRFVSHDEFLGYIDFLSNELNEFLNKNNLKVDYIVPILRSGAVPAVYISNRLNIVKFAPFQVKHILTSQNENKIDIIFNPLNELKITKKEPVFLVVEGSHSTGTSVELCIDEILKKYKSAKILYVCLVKAYESKSFADKVIFERTAHIAGHHLSIEECEKLNLDPNDVIYPWETLEGEITHPDDLEENIFF